MKSKVFVFEGLDFTGKSSISKYCKEELEKFYPGKVVHYRNPGGTPLGEKIRDIARIEAKSPEEQTFAFLLSLTSVKDQVLKDIQDDKIVLLDRWFPSLWCYQLPNITNTIIRDNLRSVCLESAKEISPQYFFFDVSFDVMEERLKNSNRPDTTDRFETSSVDYRHTIHRCYQSLMRRMEMNYDFGPAKRCFNTDIYSLEKLQPAVLRLILQEIEGI